MANETGSILIAAAYATDMISREIAESLTAYTGVVSYVWQEQAIGTNVIKFNASSALTAASFVDTTGMSLSSWNPTAVNVTAGNIGVASRVTGMAEALRPSTLAEIGQEQGKAVAVKIDTDLTALFSSVTSAVTRSATTLRMADWLTAIGTLNVAKVPLANRIGVVSATQYRDLISDSQTSNPYAFQQAALSGVLPAPFGVPVFLSQTCTTANSGANSVGAMFERKAFGFGSVVGVSVEVSRAPAANHATDIATVVKYGVALTDTNRAVRLVSQAS